MLSWLTGLPRWAYGAAAVVALLAAAGGWLYFHDRSVIKNHDAKQAAKVNETVLEAERNADRNDTKRREVRERQTDDLRAAREQAIEEHPDETNDLAGPAVRAVLGELRNQAAGNQHTPG